jgi:hypothetical protein
MLCFVAPLSTNVQKLSVLDYRVCENVTIQLVLQGFPWILKLEYFNNILGAILTMF